VASNQSRPAIVRPLWSRVLERFRRQLNPTRNERLAKDDAKVAAVALSPDKIQQELIHYYRSGLSVVDAKTSTLLSVAAIAFAVSFFAVTQAPFRPLNDFRLVLFLGFLSLALEVTALILLLIAAEILWFDEEITKWIPPNESVDSIPADAVAKLIQSRLRNERAWRTAFYYWARMFTFAAIIMTFLIGALVWKQHTSDYPTNEKSSQQETLEAKPSHSGHFILSRPLHVAQYCRLEIDLEPSPNVTRGQRFFVSAKGVNGEDDSRPDPNGKWVTEVVRKIGKLSFAIDDFHQWLEFTVTDDPASRTMAAEIAEVPCVR
jgi:hypothetical protein